MRIKINKMDDEQTSASTTDMTRRRREARRRNLLLKSEERMKKIAGYCKSEDSPKVDSESYESVAATTPLHELVDDDNTDRFLLHRSEASTSAVPRSCVAGRGAAFTTADQSVPAPSTAPVERRHDFTEDTADDATARPEKEAKAAVHASFTRYRTMLVILVGVLVRVAMLYTFGETYVQTVVNPFIALEVAIFGYQKAVGMGAGRDAGGGPLMSALVLGGFNPEAVAMYRRVNGLLSDGCADFAVYFFSFVLTHVCLVS